MQKTKFKETEIGKIPEDWEVEQLQKISRVIDSCHKTPKYSPNGIAMVRVTDIKYGDLDLKDTLKVSKEVYGEFTLNHKPKKNDIVMSRVGTYGISSFVNTDENFCLGQNTVVIHPSLNSRFIYYSLNSKLVQRQIEEEVTGSTQKTISLKDIRELLIAFPKNELEQHTISKVLSSLDSKIELNREMNKTLEAIGQTIFKHWFVDFEFPNEKGKPYKSSGGEMVETELGEIPERWLVKKIEQVVEIKGGSTPSTTQANYWFNGEINWCTPKDLSKLKSPILLSTERKITQQGLDAINSGILPKGTLLLSSRAPIGYLAISEIPTAINQGFIAILCKKELSNYFMLFWTKTNMNIIESMAHGTTFQEINKASFRSIKLITPPQIILKKYDEMIHSIYSQIALNEKESQSLSQIRNSLLPKLMSGKIRVPIEVRT